MSAQRRRRQAVPRQERASHLRVPLGIAVREAIDAEVPTPAKPTEVTIATEEEAAARDAERQREAANRLWLNIHIRQPVRYVPAVPLDCLEAWVNLNAPELWDRMKQPPAPAAEPVE